MEKPESQTLPPAFTSRQSPVEWLCALLWLPVHLLALPRLFLLLRPGLDGGALNAGVYAVGALWMLVTQFRFLRRDFDPLADRPFRVAFEVLLSYGSMLLFNIAVNALVLLLLGEVDNPNNAAVSDMARSSSGPATAFAVFLAPFTEELMFRAAIFGPLRRRSRVTAYLLGMLLFAAYHVFGYALRDPAAWVYLLQYLPIGFLLCRLYERTNTVWAPMLLHALINYLSLHALKLLEQML